MSQALVHLRFCTAALNTSVVGIMSSLCLLMIATLVVVLHAQGSALPSLLLWVVTVGALSSIALVVAGASEGFALGPHGAHPALPIDERVRGCVEASAWLPIWAVAALVALAPGPTLASDGSRLFVSTGPLTAVLLGLPMLTLGAYLPALTSATVLPVTTLAVVEATCLQLGLQGPLAAAGIAVVLTPIVIALGPRIRRCEPISWRSRPGARSRPPCEPTQRLLRDAVRGVGLGAVKLLPCAVLLPALAALLIAVGARLSDAGLGETLAWASATGLVTMVGGLVFFPFGLTGRTAGPQGLNSDMDGGFGRAWSVLPVSRRSVVLGVYLPGLAAALVAVTGVVLLTRCAGAPWVQPPTDAFVACMFAYGLFIPALATAGLVGRGGPRLFAGVSVLAVLAVTLLAAVTKDPRVIGATIGAATLVGVVLPCWMLLRRS